MKNIPILPDQKILAALDDFKSICFMILDQKNTAKETASKNIEQLEREYLRLKSLLATSKLEIFSLEFYSAINEITQRISALRINHASSLNYPGLNIILNAFNDLAVEQVYKHPLLASQLTSEILPYPPVTWPHAGMSEQEIFNNLDQLKDFVHQATELAAKASQRSSETDQKILDEWAQKNTKNSAKDADFIDTVMGDSLALVVVGAAAALLADRAARAAADFDSMLKDAKNYLKRENK